MMESETVTVQVALFPDPSSAVAVMVAVPAFTPLTLPLETVAMEVFEDFHVTALFVALVGAIVAVKVPDAPVSSARADWFKVTFVT